MEKIENLKERILEKGKELIKIGKIPIKDVEAWLSTELEAEKKNNPLIRTEIGWLSNIAIRYGVTINPEPDEDAGFTWLNIVDLPSRIDTQDNEAIAIKAKVISAVVTNIPKKDKETGNIVAGEHKEIARIEIADKTGIAVCEQWEYVSDGKNVFDELFDTIKKGTIVNKTIILKKIKPSRSRYTGHQAAVKVQNGGRIDFDEEEMKFDMPKYETTSIKSILGNTDMHFFLLKITNEPTQGVTKKKNPYKMIPVMDSEGEFAKVNLWFKECVNINAKKDDVLLVEGRVEEEEYQGKKYKKINFWRQGEHMLVVNPAGYAFTRRGSELVQKPLLEVKINDYFETTLMFKRFFAKKPYYLSCPVVVDIEKDRRCNKGVSLQGQKWTCNGGHVLTDEEANDAKRVVILSGEVVDEISFPFSIFDRGSEETGDGTVKESIVEKITGINTQDLLDRYDKAGEQVFYDMLNQDVAKKFYKIRARVELDGFKGRPSLRLIDAEQINNVEEIERIKKQLIATV